MRALSPFLAAWRGTRPPGFAHVEERARVRLLGAPIRGPESQIERLLAETLASKGPLPRPALVSQAATALYREELSQGGWLVDLGLFGERLFVSDISRALDAARGVLWEIEIPSGC